MCEGTLKLKNKQKNHFQVDHIGIKDFKHKCELCDAQFINATHLRDHVTNKHSGGSSYTCHTCGMGFKHLSTCVRHKRVVHGGDTPYVCQVNSGKDSFVLFGIDFQKREPNVMNCVSPSVHLASQPDGHVRNITQVSTCIFLGTCKRDNSHALHICQH